MRRAALAPWLLALGTALAAAAGSAAGDSKPTTQPFPEVASNAAVQSFDIGDADSPGIDPIVTGPTSPAFKARQAKLGCAEAVWPKIPAGCYPD